MNVKTNVKTKDTLGNILVFFGCVSIISGVILAFADVWLPYKLIGSGFVSFVLGLSLTAKEGGD
jgi:hypothetical protein